MDPNHIQTDLLRGRWFSLVPLMPKHHAMLYELGFREQNSFRWRYRGGMPSYSAFEQSLYAGVLCQFAICPNSDLEKFSGLVVAYNASTQDDHCFLAVVSDRRAGPGVVEGVALLFRFLFRNWPLRKIYLEAIEFNVTQYASAVRLGIFKEEGRLKAHHFFNGQYWDQIIYAVYRSDAKIFSEEGAMFLPEES